MVLMLGVKVMLMLRDEGVGDAGDVVGDDG